ncbi:hypothetical protein IMCC21224_113083 [Puniceibacterium sp. IMCC21224]|nr:hypothetical protein IMCC21224_113083 [Puniceibacterium sp. IMCC21224]
MTSRVPGNNFWNARLFARGDPVSKPLPGYQRTSQQLRLFKKVQRQSCPLCWHSTIENTARRDSGIPFVNQRCSGWMQGAALVCQRRSAESDGQWSFALAAPRPGQPKAVATGTKQAPNACVTVGACTMQRMTGVSPRAWAAHQTSAPRREPCAARRKHPPPLRVAPHHGTA